MTRKALVAVAGGLLLGLGLTGCGTGQDAATSRTLESIPGVSADDAGIAVRNAMVVYDPAGYPTGGEAPIQLTVVNETQEPVSLTGADSTGALSVVPEGGAIELAPDGYATVTLLATGLAERLDGTVALPVTLTFSNGAELALEVPTATPMTPEPREPMELEEEEEEH